MSGVVDNGATFEYVGNDSPEFLSFNSAEAAATLPFCSLHFQGQPPHDAPVLFTEFRISIRPLL